MMIDKDWVAENLKKLTIDGEPVTAPEVRVAGAYPRLIATVTSASFAGMDEAERQEVVWKYLREHVPEPDDLQMIEFVFTNAPGEVTDEVEDAG